MFSPTIGLEIHIELKTEAKMFCGCLNNSDEKKSNVNVCPVCMAHPGTLPVINEEAVKKVLKTALALNCQIAEKTFFERKNYFYPDLPKGYQISQYQAPLSKQGYLDLPCIGKRIRIERIHLEEDTGRLYHPEGKNYSLVDFNRAGVPLMELVTEPDIKSVQEAREFVKELQLILRYLAVSDVDMEKGQMRTEVNISLLPQSQISNLKPQELGTKVEIKNLNSLKSVEKAIEYEIKRQSKVLEAGEKVIQETRGWHDKKEITFSQRSKEQAHDYRYFPEPDLPPLAIISDDLSRIKSELLELPQQKRSRLSKEYNLSLGEVEFFVLYKEIGDFFEQACSELRGWVESSSDNKILEPEFQRLAKLASNYIATDLQGLFKERNIEFEIKHLKMTPENFAEFLSLIYKGEISSKIAKMVLLEMFEQGGDPSQIIADKGWQMVSNESQIEEVVQEVIAENEKAVDDFKKGKEASLQFLIGKIMQKTKGRANPDLVRQKLNQLINL